MSKKRLIIFIGLIAMVLLYFLSETILGYVIYPNTSPSIAGSSDILDIYYSNANWIDFLIFLMLFVGLGYITLGKTPLFEGRGKIVVIALGLVLSFALLIWENKTGFYLLEEFGPFVFWGALIIGGVLFIKAVAKKISPEGKGLGIAISSIFLLAYIAIYGRFLFWDYIFDGFANYYPLNTIVYSQGVYNILYFGHWIVTIFLIFAIFKYFKDRK
ncbi:MAG: hypothetical protein PHE43_00390 [Candidatus Nanoarchaeia archaeon]|nr:hypothetical protein [Candidatus Nanoarchaeia archaeon]